MDDLKLEVNHTYLLRYGCTDTVSSVTVLMITDKAYKIRWNGSGSETWEVRRRMYSDYSLLEDISDFVASQPEEKQPIKENPFNWSNYLSPFLDVNFHPYFLVEEQCPTCGGIGTIPDTHTTSSRITCPDCNGSKKKSKKVEIHF